jgi:hypothetical protein
MDQDGDADAGRERALDALLVRAGVSIESALVPIDARVAREDTPKHPAECACGAAHLWDGTPTEAISAGDVDADGIDSHAAAEATRARELRAHLCEVHGCLPRDVGEILPSQLGRTHWEEHNLQDVRHDALPPHGEPVHLHVWLDGNTARVDPEAAQLLAEALAQPRDTFVSRERPIRLPGTEPEPATEERERSDEYDEEHLRALREGSQPLPTPSDRASAHDLLITFVAKRKDLGLRRYGSLLQAGNGRDSLRDALEEVVDLAAYLVVWQEARDEALVQLEALRGALQHFDRGDGELSRVADMITEIHEVERLLGGAL